MKNNFWTINKKILSKTFYEWEKKKTKELGYLNFYYSLLYILNFKYNK